MSEMLQDARVEAENLRFRAERAERERDEAFAKLTSEEEEWDRAQVVLQARFESLAHDHAKAVAERDEARAELAKVRWRSLTPDPSTWPAAGQFVVVACLGDECALRWRPEQASNLAADWSWWIRLPELPEVDDD